MFKNCCFLLGNEAVLKFATAEASDVIAKICTCTSLKYNPTTVQKCHYFYVDTPYFNNIFQCNIL